MLANELKTHLTKKILPFWENLADEKNGGYYGYVDKHLVVDTNAHKGCILNSRTLWAFATAARVLEDDRYLTYARRAYDFMQRFEDKENGGVYWSVTAQGEPLDLTKHTYCQAFAIYGLAAYARATGLAEPIEKAMELFRVIEDKCTDAGGYGEAYKCDFSPKNNDKLSENGVMASRTMNTLLHVLEAYAELYRACGSEDVRRAGIVCLERFLKVMYNKEKRRLEVFYDAEYNSLLDMQSFGHDIEASWLIWDAVECLLPEGEREPYKAMCIALAESVHERAMTDHGLKNEIVNGEVDELRIWWVQAEALLGFSNAWELTGNELFKTAVEVQWPATQRLVVDPRPNGEWYWSVYEDGTMTERPMVEEWKCPYHNGRMCLRIIEQNKR
ncbi:MAG: N-acylglucosamine 2-epimerase [Clostridiales bacterium]|nr:N-acylglucosamine 2-epimerase [Clostridiales bacterium]